MPLTVYALPQPGQAMRDDAARRVWTGRWKMIIIGLVCAAPVLASYFTYYVIRPEGRRNHGVLIEPQRPLPDIATTALDGRAGSLRDLKDQWLLVSVRFPAGLDMAGAAKAKRDIERMLRAANAWDKPGRSAQPAAGPTRP